MRAVYVYVCVSVWVRVCDFRVSGVRLPSLLLLSLFSFLFLVSFLGLVWLY